jgi:hypothetical protein
MMKMKKCINLPAWIAALSFLVIAGCELEVTNPNSATEDQVLNSADGVEAFTIGMQGFFASSVYDNIVLNTGVTTREMAINTTFASLIELEAGGRALPPENSRINGIWNGLMRVISMNDQILADAPEVVLIQEDLSGIIALSGIYKAMALGYAVQSFEQSPITAGNEAAFSSREEVLAEALRLLDSALQQINSIAPSDNFNNGILLTGFDLENTIYALQARYNLFAGNYQAAIDAANQIDMSATSVFSYDGSTNRNPIFDAVASGDEGQEYAPRDNFGSPLAEAGDQRLGFYLNSADTTSTPNGLPIDNLAGFYTTADADIPVYLPGEIMLIKAEAYVRLNQLGLAVEEINNVRTKTAGEDAFGVGADLPPYTDSVDEASLLEEIFYQRSAELYLSGMRFEDMRRLNRPVPADDPPLTAERNRVYYPYPTQERQNNPNTPENPAI